VDKNTWAPSANTDQSLNLDFSTPKKVDGLENLDFDKFLNSTFEIEEVVAKRNEEMVENQTENMRVGDPQSALETPASLTELRNKRLEILEELKIDMSQALQEPDSALAAELRKERRERLVFKPNEPAFKETTTTLKPSDVIKDKDQLNVMREKSRSPNRGGTIGTVHKEEENEVEDLLLQWTDLTRQEMWDAGWPRETERIMARQKRM
jgi:hypothetical protein